RQQDRLTALLRDVLPRSPFYVRKFAAAGLGTPAQACAAGVPLDRLPLTTKAELLADQEEHPPYGSNLTQPRAAYVRLHQTSGTTAPPRRWRDPADGWDGLRHCGSERFRFAGLHPADRLFSPFSFGPSLGFWTAFGAASRRGWFCLPGGGMNSSARL